MKLFYTLIQTRFELIRHVYPTRGHSYLPCDRDFARLALLKKKQDTIYTAEQWFDVLRSDGPMNASWIEVSQEMIMDYKKHLSQMKDPKPIPIGRCDKKIKWAVTS